MDVDESCSPYKLLRYKGLGFCGLLREGVRERSGGLFVLVMVLGGFERKCCLRQDEVGWFDDGVDGLWEWLERDGVGLCVDGSGVFLPWMLLGEEGYWISSLYCHYDGIRLIWILCGMVFLREPLFLLLIDFGIEGGWRLMDG